MDTFESILKPGDIIGKYQVVRCLGIGGMGEVHLVRHLQLNSFRALKLLRTNFSGNDSKETERFLREARIAARIHHKNIVSVMDVENDTVSGFLYIVMEYIDGSSLQEILHGNYLPEGQAVHIISEVVNGLAAASEHGLVHRDIKPSNIMISQEGEVKLADLGIAKASDADVSGTLTMENAVVGTPAYASPEQCSDAHDVDVRADIYSLGATLYELVTGRAPFSGANPFDTIAHVINDAPVPPRQLNPEISEALEKLILKMLEKDRELRPQSITELQQNLQAFLADDAIVSPEIKKLIHERVEREVQARTSTVLTSYRKKQKGERLVILAAVLVLLILAGIFYLYRNQQIQSKFKNQIAAMAQHRAEKTELINQITSLKNQLNRQKQLHRQLTEENRRLTAEINRLKGTPVTMSGSPDRTISRPAAAAGRETGRTAAVTAGSVPQIPSTIEERIAHVEARIRELTQQTGGNDETFRSYQLELRREQLKRLRSQLQVRDRARSMRQRSFNAGHTRELQEKFARYTAQHRDWGYSGSDIRFSESLIESLKSNDIDPNLQVVDSTYNRYSGPLIKCVLSGRIQQADKIVEVLLERHADSSLLIRDKNLLGQQFGSASRAAALILTRGGFDSMSGILILKSSQLPYQAKLIEDLLMLDHNVTERDNKGNTALHYAAQAGAETIVRLLIALDADVNARNNQEETPLFAATRNAQDNVVQLLLRHGARPDITNYQGKTAEDFKTAGEFLNAVKNGRTEAAETLLKQGVDPNTVFSSGDTALHMACLKRDIQMVNILLANRADPNIKQQQVRWLTPLQLSVSRQSSSLEIARLLLRYGADPNVPPPGYGGITLLQTLCERYSPIPENIRDGLLRLLLDCPRTRLTSRNGQSFLSTALRNKKPTPFVMALLRQTKTIPASDPALNHAIANNYPQEVRQALIARGAQSTPGSGTSAAAGSTEKSRQPLPVPGFQQPPGNQTAAGGSRVNSRQFYQQRNEARRKIMDFRRDPKSRPIIREMSIALAKLDAARFHQELNEAGLTFYDLSCLGQSSFGIPPMFLFITRYNQDHPDWDTRKIHSFLSYCVKHGYRFIYPHSFFGSSFMNHPPKTKHQRNQLAIMEFILSHPESLIYLNLSPGNQKTAFQHWMLGTFSGHQDFPVWLERIAEQGLLDRNDRTLADRLFLYFHTRDSVSPDHSKCLEKLNQKGFSYQVLTPGDRNLIMAIRSGDLARVRHSIGKENADPKKRYPVKGNALYIAANSNWGGNIEIIRILLQNGATPNVPGISDNTPLAAAISLGNKSLLNLLLEHKASLNDISALDAAVRKNNTRMAERLLLAGTPPSRSWSTYHKNGQRIKVYGNDLLFRAMEQKNNVIAILLVRKGVNLKSTRNGLTPLQFTKLHPGLEPVARAIQEAGQK